MHGPLNVKFVNTSTCCVIFQRREYLFCNCVYICEGLEVGPFTLREECGLKMIENGVLRELYGVVMEEIKEYCRKLHS